MQKKEKHYEMDMCHGPLLKKMLIYALPLIASGILQLCYNAADIVVVGRFAGAQALAAVGANTHLIDLMINLFLGLSIGINVVVAQNYGAKNLEAVNETIHTSMFMALGLGILVGVLGIIFGEELLIMMNCPTDILHMASLYLTIYCIGIPASMIYNFGAAILRAVGNTKQPLYYLTLAGIVNVALNLILVIFFHMDVAGVAIATIISQYLSAWLCIRCLMHMNPSIRFTFKRISLKWKAAKSILYLGVPAGLQSTLIALPNVLIDAAINTFGSLAVAGASASNNLEGFIHAAMVAVSNTAMAFTGQNVGGKQYSRISKIIRISMGMEFVVSIGMAGLICLLSKPLLGLYLPTSPEAVTYGTQRNLIVFSTIFLMGFINVFMAGMRGMGSSIAPAVTVLIGLCGVRIIWIYTAFQANPTLPTIYAALPVSWIVTAVAQFVLYKRIYNKFMKTNLGNGAA